MRLNDKTRAQLYKSVFDTPDGRVVLADILTKAFVFRPMPGPEHESARILALHIMSFVGYDKERFPEYMVETEREISR